MARSMASLCAPARGPGREQSHMPAPVISVASDGHKKTSATNMKTGDNELKHFS